MATDVGLWLARIVLGPPNRLGYLWRFVLFYLLGTYVVFPMLGAPLDALASLFHLQAGLTPGATALGEFRNFLTALLCTGLFARFEHRRIDSYGLRIDSALGGNTFEGIAAGVVMAGAVALGMLFLGGMKIVGLAASGAAVFADALFWLVANVFVGLAEEFWFRSYAQQTLWKAIGFWPSAGAIALIFAAEHYFFKEGENVWDVVTLVSLSLLLSYSMLRSGTLWFAVGFHIAYDFMQLFVIGTPNGARVPADRLLDVQFTGPAWLTGGALGTEASFLMYPAIALLWLYVWWRWRGRPALDVMSGAAAERP